MSIDCASITDIKIDGSNQAFGGFIYNLTVTISYNSSSQFELEFISEKGEYDINAQRLSSESPSILKIGETSISVLPISYSVSESPSGNLLSVRYKDMSVRYLDKTLVGLKGIHVTDDQEDDYQKIISIGRKVRYTSLDDSGEIVIRENGFSFSGEKSVYSSDQLWTNIQAKGIPVTEQFENALITSNNEYKVVKDYHGNLRSVLQSWGTDLGYVFFWNFLYQDQGKSSIGAIDAIRINDSLSNPQAKALSDNIKESYYKYITSYNYGESIEDCYTKSGTLLTVLSADILSGKGKDSFYSYDFFRRYYRDSERGVRERPLSYEKDDKRNPIHIKIGEQIGRFPHGEFRAAVAAASLGPDFFKSFVFYCINSYIRQLSRRSPSFSNTDKGRREKDKLYNIYDPSVNFDYSNIIANYYGQFIKARGEGKPEYIGYYDKNIGISRFGGTPVSIYDPNHLATVNVEKLTDTAHDIAMNLGKDSETLSVIQGGGSIIVSRIEIIESKFENMDADDLFIQLQLYAKYNNRFYWRDSRRDKFEERSYTGTTEFKGNSISTQYTELQEVATYMSRGKSVQIGPFIRDGKLYTDTTQPPAIEGDEESHGVIIYDAGSKIVLPDKLKEGFTSKSIPFIDGDPEVIKGEPISKVTLVSSNLSSFYKILSDSDIKTEITEEKIRVSYTSNKGQSESDTEIYKRLINNLDNPYVSENELSLEEVSIEELAYSRHLSNGQLTLHDVITAFANKEFQVQTEPSFFSEFSMSTIPALGSNWFRYGLDSFSISYGPNGINTTIRVSTQRRASETLDMIRSNLARKAGLTTHSKQETRSTWQFPPKFRTMFRRA